MTVAELAGHAVAVSQQLEGSLGVSESHAYTLGGLAFSGRNETPAMPLVSARVLAPITIVLLAGASYAAAIQSSPPWPSLGIAGLAACGAGAPILVGSMWAARRPESGFGAVLILTGLAGWLAPLWLSDLSMVVIVEGVLVFISLVFITALARADRRAGSALNRLVAALGDRPTMADWRSAIGRELGDPSVRLIVRDERSRRFHEVAPDMDMALADGPGRRWIPIGDRTAPLAVLSIDRRAGDRPELLRAVCAATSLAIGNDQIEAELRTTIARLVAAGDSERRRVARDLHDCAQQRLLSLRIHLSLACDSLPRSEERSKIEALCDEVDQALAEVRDVTHGLYPAVLSRYGVAAALRSASSRAALPVRVEDLGIARHDEAIEHAVYFCCLEALQNAAKHGGRHPSAVVRLTEHDGQLCFEVIDDGVGFAPHAVSGGDGLANLADRMRAVGGTLTVESAPGRGARVRGLIAVT